MSQTNADGPKPPEMRPDLQGPAPASNLNPALDSDFASRTSSLRGSSYSAPPSASAPPQPQTANTWQKVGISIALAVCVAVGGWYGVSHFSGAGSPPTQPVVAAATQNTKVFTVAKVDLDQKATDQLKSILAAGNSGQNGNAPAGLDALKAINAPALASLAKSSPETATDIQSGRKVLYRVYLLDFLEEDGDHVEMFVDGISYGDLYLRNAGTAFLIPLTPGKPAEIKLLATADEGGGGVTVGFISSQGEARTDILKVGESEQWQVKVQ